MWDKEIPENLVKYGKSKQGHFQVVDTIGVPHPYCLTPKHVKVASEQFNGIMGKEAIAEAERQGIYCYTCREINRRHGDPILKADEHKHSLLVACFKDMNTNEKYLKEVKRYLTHIKDMCEKDGYAGFTFLKKFE